MMNLRSTEREQIIQLPNWLLPHILTYEVFLAITNFLKQMYNLQMYCLSYSI